MGIGGKEELTRWLALPPRDAPLTRTQAVSLPLLRGILLLGGTVYLAWWLAVHLLLPTAFNPLGSRIAVSALFFLAFAASYRSHAVVRHLNGVLFGAVSLLTLHFFYLLWRNGGTLDWVVGSYFCVVGVTACLQDRASLYGYNAGVLVLAGWLVFELPALRGTLFLPGLVTIAVASTLGLRSRFALADERLRSARSEIARAVAEEQVRKREEFMSIAAHELRTPLTSLQLQIEQLRRKAETRQLDATGARSIAEQIALCERQVRKLTRLTRDMLELSRLDMQRLKLELEWFDLKTATDEVIAGFNDETLRAACTLDVSAHGDTQVHGDRFRLEQVVTNLFRNALVYGKGKPISVRLEAEGARVRLEVEDHGIGIAAQDQERIFGRFERAVDSRNYGGLGIGLYISREIVAAHGGSLAVRSEPGQGATFTVQLPREPAVNEPV